MRRIKGMNEMEKEINVLLIQCEQNFQSHLSVAINSQVVIPVGLMYLSSFLKEKFAECGLGVDLIDMAVDDLDVGLKRLKRDPHIVGIRGLSTNKDFIHATWEKLRARFPRALLVAGGPYICAEFKIALLDKSIDLAVIGEGEYPLLDIVRCVFYDKRDELFRIPGVAYYDAERGTVVRNENPLIVDVNAMPMPDYSLIDVTKYADVLCWASIKRKQGVIVGSRGCPYHCVYCHNIFGKNARLRSARSMFEEIKFLFENYGIDNFFFVDDIFNINKERVMDFCNQMIAARLKVNLYFKNGFRADLCSSELIDACVDAGMISVGFSFETSSPRLQKLIGKNMDIEALERTVHYACSKEIIVSLNVMIGFPTETYAEAENSINFLRQFKKVAIPYFNVARYFPGTPMYDMALHQGCDPNVLRAHAARFFHDVRLPTPSLDLSQLETLLLKYLMEVFYDRERLLNSQRILSKYYSGEDIKDFYMGFMGKRIENVESDIMAYARDNITL